MFVFALSPRHHQVLEEGALQPVINLLESPCPDSQREAALLLGQASPEFETVVGRKVYMLDYSQSIHARLLSNGANVVY